MITGNKYHQKCQAALNASNAFHINPTINNKNKRGIGQGRILDNPASIPEKSRKPQANKGSKEYIYNIFSYRVFKSL
jgi:hypothetical protein